MTFGSCKKCGGHNISGPHYVKRYDVLRYACFRCGFTWEKPTKDRVGHRSGVRPEDMLAALDELETFDHKSAAVGEGGEGGR
jgi:hypothetical protein